MVVMTLSMENKGLKKFPKIIFEKNCEYILKLDNNFLTELPDLPDNIIEIHCSNNKLTKLPKKLPAFLQKLICNNNQITNVQFSLCNLTYIELNYNLITSIGRLPYKLVSFQATNNQLTEFPICIPDTLEYLNLSNNRIRSISDVVFPESLRILQLDNNEISTIPSESLADTYSLFCVVLSNNKIKQLPTTRFLPLNCSIFNVSYNFIESAETRFPRMLSQLSMSNNQITHFDCTDLPRLTKLDLSNNKLNSFPKNIGNHLNSLSLNYNEITRIPFEHLSETLQYLSLNGNKIGYVSDVIPRSIKIIQLENNPLFYFVQRENLLIATSNYTMNFRTIEEMKAYKLSLAKWMGTLVQERGICKMIAEYI
jgi:Leucine-rich repeat (LRR) protein